MKPTPEASALLKAAGEDLTLKQLLQALDVYHKIRHNIPGCHFCEARAKAEQIVGWADERPY